MVVISAAILSRSRILVARQFVEIARIRVEGLLSAFLKLIEHGGTDHTYIETESVRYVYQPIESLFLVLITNRGSNILEDIETLRLLQQVVQDCCQTTVNDALITENGFNIVFAFDEVLSFGYRESVTLSQIKAYTEMDSHEEKLQDLIRKSKEKDEKDRRAKIAVKLDKERAKAKRDDASASALGGRFGTALAGLAGAGQARVESVIDSFELHGAPGGAVVGEVGLGGVVVTGNETAHPTASGVGVPKKGMQINSKKPAPDLDSLRPFGGAAAAPAAVSGGDASQPAGAGAAAGEASKAINPLAEPVAALIDEKVTAVCHSEGGVAEMEVNGMLQVTVYDVARASLASFKVSKVEDSRFKLKLHPNVAKTPDMTTLELKDASKAFVANLPAPLVKWRFQSKEDTDLLPFAVTCWPAAGPDAATAAEIELTNDSFDLRDIVLRFPCGTATEVSADLGDAESDGTYLVWRVPVLDADCSSGSLSFKTRGSVLPVHVEAESQRSLSNMEVLRCYHMDTSEDLPCAQSRRTHFTVTVQD